MISNPTLILYACISKGPTILAEFSSREPELQSLAHKCVEKAPAFHSIFSHTVSKRTYTFLIQDPLVYFAIFDENVDRMESLWFLNRLKSALQEILESGSIVGTDSLTANCLQSQFNPIFRKLIALDLDLELTPSASETKDVRNPSLGSSRGSTVAVSPLLGNPGNLLKKKKRSAGEANGDAKDGGAENKVDESDDFNIGCRDFPVSAQKNGGFFAVHDRQKAKQVWKKHVWVVLILDLIICAALFGIWLWICRGFQCIDG